MLRRRRVAVRAFQAALLTAIALVGMLAGSSSGPAHAAGSTTPAAAALRIGSYDMANAGDLSHYGYLIMQASESARIPALKAAYPQLKLIEYKNMAFAIDYTCTNGVDDAQPSAGVGYCDTSRNHPDWFLTNPAGTRVHSTYFGSHWFMDVGSAAYQNAWAQNVITAARAKGWDGVMLDDANSDPSWHLGSQTLAKYPTVQTYRDAAGSFLQNVCGQIRNAGLLALPNIDGVASRATRNQWNGYCSGSVKEYWVKWGSAGDLQKTGTGWTDELAQLEDADAANKILLPITYGSMSDVRDMTFARASFLLAWNGTSSSALIWNEASVAPWSSVWTASVGAPIGARRQVTGGVWRRDFTGGTVLVNPDASATVTVALGATYTDSAGASVTSVTLGPASGAILAGTTAVATTTPPPTATTTISTTPTAATTTTPTVTTATTTTTGATTTTPPTTTTGGGSSGGGSTTPPTTTTPTTTTAATTTATVPRAPAPAPAPVAPTLGKTTRGADLTVSQPADTKYANRVALGGVGYLTAVHAFVSGTARRGYEAVRGVVYSDAGGVPGDLRGVTAAAQVSGRAGPGWITLRFSSALRLDPGAYWVGLQFGGISRLLRVGFDVGPDGVGRYDADAWGDGASTTFGAASADHEAWAVYADVTSTLVASRKLSGPVAPLSSARRAAAKKAAHATAVRRRLRARR